MLGNLIARKHLEKTFEIEKVEIAYRKHIIMLRINFVYC